MASSNPKENQLVKAEEQACLLAMLFSSSPLHIAAINAAVDLNIFDIISSKSTTPHDDDDGLSASEIASLLPIAQHRELPRRLDRVLGLLASHGLLTCCTRRRRSDDDGDGVVERVYGLSEAGKFFVKSGNSISFAYMPAFLLQRGLVNVLLNFKEVLLDCETEVFKKVNGKSIYQSIEGDPAHNHVFNHTMANLTVLQMTNIFENYNGFQGISLLVDVGGGIGETLKMVISKYPSIEGINFDLPQVIQNAPSYPGITHVMGDMFQSVPKGDAIMIKTSCHNWRDEDCLRLYRCCYEALPEKGKLIVMEYIMPDEIHSSELDKFINWVDNLQFLFDGRERTVKEYETLCKQSGFAEFHVACHVFPSIGVMEFIKS